MPLNSNQYFLSSVPQGNRNKSKITRWDLIIFTSFCTAKETINRMKRQPTEWEKTFLNGFNFQNIKTDHTIQ